MIIGGTNRKELSDCLNIGTKVCGICPQSCLDERGLFCQTPKGPMRLIKGIDYDAKDIYGRQLGPYTPPKARPLVQETPSLSFFSIFRR